MEDLGPKAIDVLLGEVEVLEAVGNVGGVVPRDLEVGLELLGEADARARVGGDVQPRVAGGTRVLGDLVEEVVLGDAEGARLHGAVVGDDDEGAALGVLGGLERSVPGDHTHLVGADDGLATDELAVGAEQKLISLEERRGHRGVRADGDGLLPRTHDRLLEETEEVVGVGGADAASERALGLERARHGVGLEIAGLVLAHRAVGDRRARDWVEVLEVAVELEPLAGHGGGHQANGLPLAVANV
mmetsp:Transcript_13375/g.28896  ORF Transcript_13375/g.28896 Transcript_13375/m.28896 type:complete len:244 (+) Transcript_13375:1759-2490(+)